MKKRFLATLLTLVMALALTAPALAAELTLGTEINSIATTFSDVVSQERIKGYPGSMAQIGENTTVLVTVKVGTTLTLNSGYHSNTGVFYEAELQDGDGYDYKVNYVSGKTFKPGKDARVPYTLTEENIGLWFFNSGDDGGYNYLLKVVANNTPTEPEKPSEPEKPTEPTKPAETEKPTEPTKPAEPAVAGTCTAKKYDTWGQIALNNYGTYSKAVWSALKAANKGVALKEGATINLPEKIGKYALLPAQVLAEGETLYTVKAGDTLGQIAVNTYKDINMYKAIFERNSDRLTNVNSIYEGQVIVLPAKPAK